MIYDPEVKAILEGYEQRIADLERQLAEARAQPVAVRQLVWDSVEKLWMSNTSIGYYQIEQKAKFWLWYENSPLNKRGWFDTLEEALAFAQANYEARIRAALTQPAPAQEGKP